MEQNPGGVPQDQTLLTKDTELLVPVPRPRKLFLLAGNYAKHIEEGGEIAAERAETFPYVFMKPPTTTLTNPGQPVRIPSVSPAHVDWELELAVIIGREAKGVPEALGIVSLGKDLAIDIGLRLHLDAAAALEIVERRGVGRVRRLEVASFWL